MHFLLTKTLRYLRRNTFRMPKICVYPIKTRLMCYNYAPTILLPSIGLVSKTLNTSNDDDIEELEDNITQIIFLAKVAMEKGDKDRAEAILQMGLKLCAERNVTFGIPFMYDILATIAVSNDDYDKAEQLLITAIDKMSKGGAPENDYHIINFKLRLARMYSSNLEYDLAELGFKTCLEAQKKRIIDGDVSTKTGILYVNIMYWYGIHKIHNKEHASAKELVDTAYDYSTKIKGLSAYQEMVILYTLADLNMDLYQYDVALLHMQNAIMLGNGIGSTELPRCYVKLAKIYLKMNAYDLARSSAEEGVRMAALLNLPSVVKDGEDVLRQVGSELP